MPDISPSLRLLPTVLVIAVLGCADDGSAREPSGGQPTTGAGEPATAVDGPGLTCPGQSQVHNVDARTPGARAWCCVGSDGTRSGPYVEIDAAGKTRVAGAYAGGQQQGAWQWWHESGERARTGEYVRGVPTGAWQYWDETGSPLERCTFVDGRKEGPATMWDADGTERAVVYQDGQLVPRQ